MTRLFQEYGPIRVFFGVAVLLSVVRFGVSMLRGTQYTDAEKVSAYECGFNPFDDARNRFDIRFYLVSILFIVFDLEATFLFPLALTLAEQSYIGLYTMLDFFAELVVGFVYALKRGALELE